MSEESKKVEDSKDIIKSYFDELWINCCDRLSVKLKEGTLTPQLAVVIIRDVNKAWIALFNKSEMKDPMLNMFKKAARATFLGSIDSKSYPNMYKEYEQALRYLD